MMKSITTGTESFKDLIDQNYYYVDKTKLIEDVLTDKVMLYTRPRRFGKSLNMSMLYYFFSNKEKDNSYLFDGLNITNNKEMMKHQNQYPVIFISLKEMKDLTFQEQKNSFSLFVFDILDSYQELLESDKISNARKRILENLYNREADETELKNALKIISQALYQHYNQKVIVLIDEYDVPLQTAYLNGYYDKMASFLGSVFSSVLKTNEALERGVLTGCLRIAKESIFTGLNNFTVRSTTSQYASDLFGFTQKEIDALLAYYNLSAKKDEVKEWYDGYLFGNTEIYNPWSTLNYVRELIGNPKIPAVSFWINTSGNDIVKEYIEYANSDMKEEFEVLISGKSIIKKISPELTYREMDFKDKHGNINLNDDIYSFLLFTGYLKTVKYLDNDTYELVIPNKEVHAIYDKIFKAWFKDFKEARKNDFIVCLQNQKEKEAQKLMNEVLRNRISYYDNYESFYHGFLVGFLQSKDYEVKSNRESGDGRFDIAILPTEVEGTAIVLECKHSASRATLKKDSEEAAKQIIEKDYYQAIHDEGFENVVGYGISFLKKQCYITKV